MIRYTDFVKRYVWKRQLSTLSFVGLVLNAINMNLHEKLNKEKDPMSGESTQQALKSQM